MSAVRTTGGPYRHARFEVPSPPRRTRWGFVAVGLALAALLERGARRVPVMRTAVGEVRRDAAPYHVLRFPAERVEPLRDVVAFAPSSDGLLLVRTDGTAWALDAYADETSRAVARRTFAPPWRSDARAALGVRHYGDYVETPRAHCLWIDAQTEECERGERTRVMRDDADGDGRARYHDTPCELRGDGSVRCRGGVASGRVRWRSRPAPIAADARFRALAMADDDTCGVTVSGDVRCWGPSLRSVRGVRDARALALRHGLGCALLAGGDVSCWPTRADGAPVSEPVATRVEPLPPAVSIAATAEATCALDAAGTVRCWGAFGRAWPGHPRAYRATRPLDVALPAPTASLHPTAEHVMCARDARGVSRCWGGAPDRWTFTRPVETLGDATMEAVWEEEPPVRADLELLDDGRVIARNPLAPRGWSVLGDLPRAVALVAVDPIERSDGRSVAPHACALARDGVAWCWGDNRAGQLGLDDAVDADAWTTVHVTAGETAASPGR
ncbi:MAG: RCC1 domain-containing protein [Polyangiales bacterium]